MGFQEKTTFPQNTELLAKIMVSHQNLENFNLHSQTNWELLGFSVELTKIMDCFIMEVLLLVGSLETKFRILLLKHVANFYGFKK